MKFLGFRPIAKSVALSAVGFLAGTLGISAYGAIKTDTVTLASKTGPLLASANSEQCPLAAEETESVFFLSCGGIF